MPSHEVAGFLASDRHSRSPCSQHEAPTTRCLPSATSRPLGRTCLHAQVLAQLEEDRLEQRGRGIAGAARSTAARGPHEPIWTGSWALPTSQQGIVVLGSVIGSRAFLADKLAQKLLDRLLQRIPHVPHLQSLRGCCSSTAPRPVAFACSGPSPQLTRQTLQPSMTPQSTTA